MKKLIIGAAVLVLGVGAAQAQTTPDTTPKQEKYHKAAEHHRMKNLSLTAMQKEKIKAFRQEHKAKAAALKADTKLTAEQQQQERKALAQQYRTQLQSLLTEEQKAKMAQHGKHGQHKMKGTRNKDFKKELTLTGEQSQKLSALRAEFKVQAVEIRKNETLTMEQKKEQLHNLAQTRKEKQSKVLTLAQMQVIKAERRKGTDETK